MANYHAVKIASTVCAQVGHQICTIPADGSPKYISALKITITENSTLCVRCGLSLQSILGRAESRMRKSSSKPLKSEGKNADSK